MMKMPSWYPVVAVILVVLITYLTFSNLDYTSVQEEYYNVHVMYVAYDNDNAVLGYEQMVVPRGQEYTVNVIPREGYYDAVDPTYTEVNLENPRFTIKRNMNGNSFTNAIGSHDIAIILRCYNGETGMFQCTEPPAINTKLQQDNLPRSNMS